MKMSNPRRADFIEDLWRYLPDPEERTLKNIATRLFFEESLWFLFCFRLAKWVRRSVRIPLLRQILMILTRVLHRFMCLVTGIQIPIETRIGPGLYIGHGGKVVVNSDTAIGERCNISTG